MISVDPDRRTSSSVHGCRRPRRRDAALVYPKAQGGNVYDRLQEACVTGGTSFYTSGGDPGWAGFGLALAPLTIAQQVRSIKLFEIYNYGPWNNPQLALYGFGKPDTSSSMILAPGHGEHLGTERRVARGRDGGDAGPDRGVASGNPRQQRL